MLIPNSRRELRPMSDRLILAIAFSVGIFICAVSWLANTALLACGYPEAMSLVKCDAAGGITVGSSPGAPAEIWSGTIAR